MTAIIVAVLFIEFVTVNKLQTQRFSKTTEQLRKGKIVC
jgi:hypothetical protein